MEENNFLDVNPQFMGTGHGQYVGVSQNQYGNAIERAIYPHLAEQAQFEKENYLVDKANAFTEYMFNKANEYNSPEKQMERMKAAGINPLLAAGGIAGNGATAQGAQGAQGSAPMNTSGINPIELLEKGVGAFTTGISGINELGTLLGFGKKNKAEIALIKTNATKAAEEMKYTRRQRKQLEGIGEILIENAKKEGNQIEANISVLQETIEKLKEETKNIAQDTTLKTAQTGQTLEQTKDLVYKNYENEFKKIFREMFGIQLNESDMSMLVQACLNGNGEQIANFFVETIKGVVKGIKDNIQENIPTAQQAKEFVADKMMSLKDWIKEKKEKRRKDKDREWAYNHVWKKNEEELKKAGFKNFEEYYKARRNYFGNYGFSGRW